MKHRQGKGIAVDEAGEGEKKEGQGATFSACFRNSSFQILRVRTLFWPLLLNGQPSLAFYEQKIHVPCHDPLTAIAFHCTRLHLVGNYLFLATHMPYMSLTCIMAETFRFFQRRRKNSIILLNNRGITVRISGEGVAITTYLEASHLIPPCESVERQFWREMFLFWGGCQ